jgi:ketosteroid isomerase-like protein
MKRAILISTLAFLASVAATAAAHEHEAGHEATKSELSGIVMKMMDAIGTGEKSVYERHLADDLILVDRDGLRTLTKKDVVDGTNGMPDGYWLKISIDDVQLRELGDHAVLTYRVVEREGIHDQEILVHYRSTNVFEKKDGIWQMVVWQYVETQRDAEPTPVDASVYDELVGTYVMGPGIKYVVTRRDNRLFGAREGREEQELIPESDLVYYHPGTEFRKIFVRDDEGRITEIRARRKGTDLRWTRVNEAPSAAGESSR